VQGERLESQHLARVLVRYKSETIPDEQEVELSSFARVSDRFENRKVLAASGGSWNPPARHVIPRPNGVYAEIHLPGRVHSCSPFATHAIAWITSAMLSSVNLWIDSDTVVMSNPSGTP
jgi:hypothetical protein